MATELYGVSAQIVDSAALNAISTDTRLVFFGTANCSTDKEKKVHLITSLSEYVSKLETQGGPNGSDLYKAAKVCFSQVGLDKAYFYPTFGGDNALEAYTAWAERNPAAVTLLVVLGNYADLAEIASALLGVCKNTDGIKSYLIYDLVETSGRPFIDASTGEANLENIIAAKHIADGYATACLNCAALRACLMAKSDGQYGVPARNGGNIPVSQTEGLTILTRDEGTQLSADGICSVISRYGSVVTWGDHTSAFSGGMVPDEGDRFENTKRMNICIANWFILTFGGILDDPMTLQMRNDIIGATQEYLNSLVGRGALVGNPRVYFAPADNPTSGVAQGHFVFTIDDTPTIPVKHLLAKVRYTQEGLSVYTAE